MIDIPQALRALPRPATPGPWAAYENCDEECGSYCSPNGCPGHATGRGYLEGPPGEEGDVIEFTLLADARAIAALPEWVRLGLAAADALDALRVSAVRLIDY